MKNKKNIQVHISENKTSLAAEAAELFAQIAGKSISDNGRFSIALSGGSTPEILYRNLVQNYADRIDWAKIYFFWSDERFVPLSHPDSNAGMAKQLLLDPLKVKRENIFYVPTGNRSPQEAAQEYEKAIRRHFGRQDHSPPSFDLILLGLGDDGHTASLFPGTLALKENNRLVVQNWVEKLSAWRITFTYPLINSAHNILFLVAGENKAQMVKEIVIENKPYPAEKVQPAPGQLYWYLDARAAEKMNEKDE